MEPADPEEPLLPSIDPGEPLPLVTVHPLPEPLWSLSLLESSASELESSSRPLPLPEPDALPRLPDALPTDPMPLPLPTVLPIEPIPLPLPAVLPRTLPLAELPDAREDVDEPEPHGVVDDDADEVGAQTGAPLALVRELTNATPGSPCSMVEPGMRSGEHAATAARLAATANTDNRLAFMDLYMCQRLRKE